MGKRVSENAWRLFKESNPDAIDELMKVVVKFDRQNIFPNHFSVRYKGSKSKNNTERFGVELGPAIDWLDENTNDEYYVEINRGGGGNAIIELVFYFHDEGDAVGFKLLIGEKT